MNSFVEVFVLVCYFLTLLKRSSVIFIVIFWSVIFWSVIFYVSERYVTHDKFLTFDYLWPVYARQ